MKKVTDKSVWMQSSCGDMFYEMDPQPASREEAVTQARAEVGVDDKYAEVGFGSGSPMPKKFPFDPEQMDEVLEERFYEESFFEQYPSEAGVLWDRIEEVWRKWREEFNVVGNAIHFSEGPFKVNEMADDQSDPG